MDIKNFLKLYVKYLNEEFNSEENKIDENDFMSVYKENGFYGIGYTTFDKTDEEVELIYDFNNQRLIWKTNEKMLDERQISNDEIPNIFNYDLVYEYFDN